MSGLLFELLLVCPAANIKVSKETSWSKRGTFQTHIKRRREYIQRPPLAADTAAKSP
jgi:hypothetical protein